MRSARRVRIGRACACLVLGLAGAARAHATEPPRAPSARAASPWSDADVRASRSETAAPAESAGQAHASPDPAGLLIIPDGDGRHLTLVDGDRLEIVRRVATRALLPGAPRRSPDGRHVYVGSIDGWITKLDLASLAVVAEVRAGIELRDIALSSDGQWLLAGNAAPHGVAIFDADLRLVKSFVAAPRDAVTTSRVAAVADAAPRQSFVVVLQDIPEIWEISYDPRAEDIYDGLVHDYRMAEGVPMRGFLNRRRSLLAAPLTSEARNIAFDPEFTNVLGALPAPGGSGSLVQIVNLDVRRRVAALAVAGTPRLDASITVTWKGGRAMAVPSPAAGAIDVIDLKSWQLVKTIATPAPVHFLGRPAGGRFAWGVAAPGGSGGNPVMLLDLATLQAPSDADATVRSCGAVVFGRGGRHAWMRPCAGDVDLVVADAETLEVVRRLPLPGATVRR